MTKEMLDMVSKELNKMYLDGLRHSSDLKAFKVIASSLANMPICNYTLFPIGNVTIIRWRNNNRKL